MPSFIMAKSFILPILHVELSSLITLAQAHATDSTKKKCFGNAFTIQWWTQEYCFLSFVPLRPSFEGDTFGSLFVCHWPRFRWSLPPSWRQSCRVDSATGLVISHISASRTIDQCISLFKTYPTLAYRVSKTVHVPTFGTHSSHQLSFKVAAISDWFSTLAEKDIPQIWLNDFGRSTVCNFSENCPRAGIILDWLNTDKNLTKPPVEWFTSHHVPVWYPWTQDHINACSKPQFAYLRPPVEVIQMATTWSPIPLPSQSRQHLSSQQFATRNTGQPATSNMTAPTAMNASAHMSQKEFNAARNAYLKTKPWAPFLKCELSETKLSFNVRQINNGKWD